MKRMWPTTEAAPVIGAAPKTMRNWRTLGKGPAFHKIGGKVLYDPDDVQEWIAARRLTSTSQPVAA